jgi:hypothetical protein
MKEKIDNVKNKYDNKNYWDFKNRQCVLCMD